MCARVGKTTRPKNDEGGLGLLLAPFERASNTADSLVISPCHFVNSNGMRMAGILLDAVSGP